MILELTHPIARTVTTWAELCDRTEAVAGNKPPGTPVRKIIRTAPTTNKPMEEPTIRNTGFNKLVKRDEGVYENITRSGSDKRDVSADDPASLRDIAAKLPD
jgi:hypothetical protein